MPSKYRWIITKDLLKRPSSKALADDPNVCSSCGEVLTKDRVAHYRPGADTYCKAYACDSTGIEGPRDLDDQVKSNPATFALYDDDDNCYYQGMLYGDYEGFEPLDDYGTPNAGCVKMKLDGEWL